MPTKYLYAHGTCAVCGYAGGLVIASPSDPRCWPCDDWAAKFGTAVPHVQRVERPVEFVDLSVYQARVEPVRPVLTVTIEKQALAFRTTCEELLPGVPLRYLDDPEVGWES